MQYFRADTAERQLTVASMNTCYTRKQIQGIGTRKLSSRYGSGRREYACMFILGLTSMCAASMEADQSRDCEGSS